jgi:hypothetical protein
MKAVNGLLICSLLLMLFCMAVAQPPDIEWGRCYGGNGIDWGTDVRQTTDGGYVFVGNTTSFGAGYYDIWLVRTNANGDTLWTRTFGGTQLDQCTEIEITNDGGYVLAGKTQSFGAGYEDIWLVKTDSMGNWQWDRTYGGTHFDQCSSIEQTFDGGYLLAGVTWSFGAGASDCWLVKTDANGDTMWTQTFGGVFDDDCVGAIQVADSGYVLVENGDYSDQGVWMVKYNPSGLFQWCHLLVDTVTCTSFQATSDGGFIFAGDSASWGCEDFDFWLMKTNYRGDPLWSRTYRGYYPDVCFDVVESRNGGYMMAGYTEYSGSNYRDFQVMKADVNGDSLWSLSFGGNGSQEANSIQPTMDGGFILIGDSWSGGADFLVVKLASECPDWTPLTPQTVIDIRGSGIRLSWLPVTESVAGCPVTIQEYRIYSSPTLLGNFQLLTTVNGNIINYLHQNALLLSNSRFYYVKAVGFENR